MIALFGALSDVSAVQPSDREVPALMESPGIEFPAPHWDQGDRWIVETVSRPMQARLHCVPDSLDHPIGWQFAVMRREVLDAYDCFRIEVQCQAAGQQPETTLWLDRHSLALRQITTHLPVPGGFQKMTLRYDFESGQTAPVLGPLTALPIDTPVLFESHTKGLGVYCYRMDFGPRQRKAIGDVGFAHQIEQRVTSLSPGEMRDLLNESFAKSLFDEAFTKSLTSRPVIEVRLKSHGREVRQLWQAERPWPIYCDNGQTVSRLIAFTSGNKKKLEAGHDRANTESRP